MASREELAEMLSTPLVQVRAEKNDFSVIVKKLTLPEAEKLIHLISVMLRKEGFK